MPKIEKYVNYMFTENICCACNPMEVLVFCKTCINFLEQQLKLSLLEGNIKP